MILNSREVLESSMDVPVAANVLGIAGAVCWSVQVGLRRRDRGASSYQVLQLIPQIIINHRRHDTTGLQPTVSASQKSYRANKRPF